VLTVFFLSLAVWLVALGIICAGRTMPSRGGFTFLGVSLGMIAVACTATWFSLDILPVRTDSGKRFLSYRRTRELTRAAHVLAGEGLIRPQMKSAELAALPQLMLERKLAYEDNTTNPYTGDPMRHERSPGNFNIRERKGKLFLCLYEADGTENSTLLSDAGPATTPSTTSSGTQPN
jgi:hypothetical protein